MRVDWERSPELEADDRRARELPSPTPDAARVARVRQGVLGATLARVSRVSRRPVRKIAFGVLALASAAAVAIFVIRRSQPPAPHNAVVESSRGARFAWVTSRPDEVLRLQEGTVSVNITPLGPGERFRVLAGDGEVEAQGGRLEVVVEQDRLFRVGASEAGAVVRVNDSAPVILSRGEEWSAPAKEVEPAPAPAPAPAPPTAPPLPSPEAPRPAHVPAPAPTHVHKVPTHRATTIPEEPAPGEAAFRTGWARFREGAFAEAARSFESACRETSATALAEDACFWHGAALERAGRSADAELALRSYLDAHARAPRAGEAHAMLGWILLRGEKRDEAARHFRAALNDPAAPVRESAKRGLDALAQP